MEINRNKLDNTETLIYNDIRKIKKVVKNLKKQGTIKESPNKYMLKYGKSITEIASIFGRSNSTISEWDSDKEKSKWLKKRLEELEGVKQCS